MPPGTRITKRHLKLSARHGDLGGAVDDRIKRQQHEIDGHDLDDRPGADQRRTDTQSGEAVFGKSACRGRATRRIGVQTFGDAVAAAIQTDIFAKDKHQFVRRQFMVAGRG